MDIFSGLRAIKQDVPNVCKRPRGSLSRMMSSLWSPNPRKRPRLPPSPPNQSYYEHSPQPSFTTLNNDRIASRAKLQSTWEDIIQKYSDIAPSETDEIDLETGEIIVNNGHLQSLHDSVLWDPLDSERDDDADDDDDGDDGFVHSQIPDETDEIRGHPPKARNHLDEDREVLPSEEDIVKQFGEKYGRDILEYLQHRNITHPPTGKSSLWTGPADEESIFTR